MKRFYKSILMLITVSTLIFQTFIPSINAEEIQADSKSIQDIEVIPGGFPFGVRIFANGICIMKVGEVEGQDSVSSPAYDAGIKENDVILKIDGETVRSAEDFVSSVESSDGRRMDITVRRNEKELTFSVKPEKSKSDGKYRLGVWVRDTTCGIGTVTFVDPKTMSFGGLGHGICEKNGELVPFSRGTVTDVKIESVVKGKNGVPGELRGIFSSGKKGSLISNTVVGVFGFFSEIPETIKSSKPIPIAKRDEVHEGTATALCTLGDDGICPYSVNISEIRSEEMSEKCFVVTVTDEKLLERTGGIVQGMSGSPIIQDGRLCGAITHVLISSPKVGYGIFIENMLSQVPEYAS